MTEGWVREALADGSALDALELHFQPVVSPASGSLFGAESFIKWRDPDGEVLATAAWLPHAHTSGALTECSRSMLPAWAASSAGPGGPIISFNLTGDQLVDSDFMREVFAIPPATAAGLAIEIHQLQFDVDHANTVQPRWAWLDVPDFDGLLGELRGHGFAVWVDDFGDDSYDEAVITHDQVDLVKLDGRFVNTDPVHLEEVVDEVHRHGKLAVLECIETEADEQEAIAAGVDLGQGFLYARPLATSDFAAFGGRNRT